MDDLSALLRAVITNPDDDTPRLMYVDQLLERDRRVPAGSGLTDDRVLAERIKQSVHEKWEPQRIDHAHRWWPLPENMVGWYVRGFYETVECTAKNFMAHAAALIWHPDDTVVCPYMKHRPVCGCKGNEYNPVCGDCGGTGTLPAPCPDTAQPIRTVVLLDVPDLEYLTTRNLDGSVTARVCGRRINVMPDWTITKTLEARFKGVKFELPPRTRIPVQTGELATVVDAVGTIKAGDWVVSDNQGRVMSLRDASPTQAILGRALNGTEI